MFFRNIPLLLMSNEPSNLDACWVALCLLHTGPSSHCTILLPDDTRRAECWLCGVRLCALCCVTLCRTVVKKHTCGPGSPPSPCYPPMAPRVRDELRRCLKARQRAFCALAEIGFTWVGNLIASADFLIKFNKGRRPKRTKNKPQWSDFSWIQYKCRGGG